MRYSEKALRIAPSATLEISAKAAQLRSEGFDVVGFGAGEPDYDTPEYIKEAAGIKEYDQEPVTFHQARRSIPPLPA